MMHLYAKPVSEFTLEECLAARAWVKATTTRYLECSWGKKSDRSFILFREKLQMQVPTREAQLWCRLY